MKLNAKTAAWIAAGVVVLLVVVPAMRRARASWDEAPQNPRDPNESPGRWADQQQQATEQRRDDYLRRLDLVDYGFL